MGNEPKKLVRCSGCGKPLASLQGNNIRLVKHDQRRARFVDVEVEHDAGGRVKISCADCGPEHYFAKGRISLGMTYAIKKEEIADEPG
jgi:hypothetical protein